MGSVVIVSNRTIYKRLDYKPKSEIRKVKDTMLLQLTNAIMMCNYSIIHFYLDMLESKFDKADLGAQNEICHE